jgi:hypothetical protein
MCVQKWGGEVGVFVIGLFCSDEREGKICEGGGEMGCWLGGGEEWTQCLSQVGQWRPGRLQSFGK